MDELDVAGRDAGALERGLDRGRAELRRGNRRERAEKASDSGAGGTDDDDVTHVEGLPRRLHPSTCLSARSHAHAGVNP